MYDIKKVVLKMSETIRERYLTKLILFAFYLLFLIIYRILYIMCLVLLLCRNVFLLLYISASVYLALTS